MTYKSSPNKRVAPANVHTVTILWAGLFLLIALGYALALGAYRSNPYLFYCLLVAGILACGIAAYLTVKALLFRRKLLACIRHLLANEYQTGMRVARGPCDEIVRFEKRINSMVDQLRVYNSLQIERISALNKSIDIVYRNIAEGIIIAYPDKREFRLNPAVQRMFQVEQEVITFDAIEKQPGNRRFVALFKEAVEMRKVITEGIVTLELPIRQSSLNVMVEIIPVKDKGESVALAIIFVNKAE